ncbi:methyltransferase, partial [Pseudonocardia pini]|uniref:methyltransferase n=1 Tax=Pseudonocardia pini TaxID=2758030 RepID=UPI0024844D47
VVAAYDFGRFRRLVDVGGGTGILLDAVRAATPGLDGVLFDRPEVVERGPADLDRIGGDFFTSVPSGGDGYLLSRVLHDWADAEALRILRACRAAMPVGTPLLVVEAVLPVKAREAPAVVRMDATMLLLATGRERTEREFAELFDAAGFSLVRTVPAGGVVVLEAV